MIKFRVENAVNSMDLAFQRKLHLTEQKAMLN